MSDNEDFIISIDRRLAAMERFFTIECPEHRLNTEHRITVMEVRMYFLCGLIGIIASQAAGIIKLVAGIL